MRAVDRLHDAHRLSVLHELDILDTDAEPAYDDLARLASICCDRKLKGLLLLPWVGEGRNAAQEQQETLKFPGALTIDSG